MGKKSKGGGNKKKGKRSGAGGGGGAKKNASFSSSASSSSSSDPSTLIKGQVPDFSSRRSNNDADTGSTSNNNYPTIYARYKSATRRFLEYMRTNVPSDVVGDNNNAGINFLLPAAEWMSTHNHAIDASILRDLKLCIRMRRRVADSIFGGGDEGHRYFLEVLVFCWTLLRVLPVADDENNISATKKSFFEKAYIAVVGGEEEKDEGGKNRFSAFNDYSMEGYDEEEDEENEDVFPTEVPRPEPVENPLTVEDLLSSDDRNDAILFLLTLDELMGVVGAQYRVLAQNMRNDNRRGISGSAMIENLLDGTIAANFAIQSVQQLEMELQVQHEHLTTPCRLLATLALPEITTQVDAIVREHGTEICSRGEIIGFLGDSMQCCFHNVSDSWNRRDSIVSEFVAKFGLNDTGSSELEQVFQGVLLLTQVEITMKIDVDVEKLRQTVSREAGKPHPSHSWLSRMKYISGNRAIHHTIRILQLFGGVIDKCPPDRKLLMDPRRRGMFGNPLWAAGRSDRIRDMDELVMSRLLPDWANMCRHGVMSKIKLDHDNELCPFFVQLKSFVDNPRKPVTWSLAFGVHAALTSMVEVGRALPEITSVSKSVFNNYFSQATNAKKLSMNDKSSNMNKANAWNHNLMMVSFLENFGLSVYDDLAIWNPLCAGTSMTVLNFFGNIEGGCAMIDCQAQLRIVMYLYHGLVINGIFSEKEIPFLYTLYKGFKKCKALWQGGSLPKKGELVKKFWISFGMGLSDSKQMSENARLLARGGQQPSDGLFAQGVSHSRGRKMQPIEPAEFLTSMRRICERDFHDVVDKYHTQEQKRNTRGMEQYNVAVRTNDTLDHLEDEIELHAINFVGAAYYLEQYVCSIGRVLGWEPLLKSFKNDTNMDMRQGFVILFAQNILGALDFVADPLKHKFQNVPGLIKLSPSPNIVAGAASFLDSFFERVPAQNLLWFQALDSGDGTNVEVVR